MEKRIGKKIDDHLGEFKGAIKIWIEEKNEIPHSVKSELLKFIYDFDALSLEKEDFMKRKRVKSIVPQYDRCNAKRANGEQCTRKRKDGLCFCGTHEKGRPHGEVDEAQVTNNVQNVEVWIEDIKGIHYYIDSNFNVYKTEDIIANKVNPAIIAKYTKEQGIYNLVTF